METRELASVMKTCFSASRISPIGLKRMQASTMLLNLKPRRRGPLPKKLSPCWEIWEREKVIWALLFWGSMEVCSTKTPLWAWNWTRLRKSARHWVLKAKTWCLLQKTAMTHYCVCVLKMDRKRLCRLTATKTWWMIQKWIMGLIWSQFARNY